MKVNRIKKRISAFLLLGVFLLALLHNVVPHFHHTHSGENLNSEIPDLGHSHANNHSHSHDSDLEKGLLQLLGHHSHNFHLHDQIVLISSKFGKNSKPTKVSLFANATGIEFLDVFLPTITSFPFAAQHCTSSSLKSITLRGPPFLV